MVKKSRDLTVDTNTIDVTQAADVDVPSMIDENTRDHDEATVNLSEQRLSIIPREGYSNYWCRESELRIRFAEGYQVVHRKPGDKVSAYVGRSQDSIDGVSCYRFPTQDSNEDLILLEIPTEKRKKLDDRRYARADYFESQLKSKKYTKGSGDNFTQTSNIQIIK